MRRGLPLRADRANEWAAAGGGRERALRSAIELALADADRGSIDLAVLEYTRTLREILEDLDADEAVLSLRRTAASND